MWSDNETERDFLNFSGTAKTVAEMILQASGRPVSIGVSGQWGVGKSSMIKLVQLELNQVETDESTDKQFIFVEFNAWLYQGFDDARAALLEVIASTLADEAKKRKKGIDKVSDFLKRVRWLRVANAVAETTGALALGIPPGIFSSVTSVIEKLKDGEIAKDEFDDTKASIVSLKNQLTSFISPKEENSPPKEIQALRDSFESALEELEITLVVFVDDLDRCLPKTTISTLEAIRLFLFLKNTAFVIAADDKMIKHAVKTHFEGLEEELVTNYFDKLIQIPIRVPALGTQEVKAYLFMLFIENSDLGDPVKEKIRSKVCEQLTQTWQGKRVDKLFMTNLQTDLNVKFSSELVARIDTADRLAKIMTTSNSIKGNPRLIKRFLNALSIRMAISKSQGVDVDEAVLIKLLLFERCGSTKAYDDLRVKITDSDNGKPVFLKAWEDQAENGKVPSLDELWESKDGFTLDWLSLPPRLSDTDLRGALYVSREYAPMIYSDDKLTPEAQELLSALTDNPDMALTKTVSDMKKNVSLAEMNIIMDKVLQKARLEEEWGTPKILESCIFLSRADLSLAERFKAFLDGLPPASIKAGLIPKIADESWASSLLIKWKSERGYSSPVKKAISIKNK